MDIFRRPPAGSGCFASSVVVPPSRKLDSNTVAKQALFYFFVIFSWTLVLSSTCIPSLGLLCFGVAQRLRGKPPRTANAMGLAIGTAITFEVLLVASIGFFPSRDFTELILAPAALLLPASIYGSVHLWYWRTYHRDDWQFVLSLCLVLGVPVVILAYWVRLTTAMILSMLFS